MQLSHFFTATKTCPSDNGGDHSWSKHVLRGEWSLLCALHCTRSNAPYSPYFLHLRRCWHEIFHTYWRFCERWHSWRPPHEKWDLKYQTILIEILKENKKTHINKNSYVQISNTLPTLRDFFIHYLRSYNIWKRYKQQSHYKQNFYYIIGCMKL